MLLLPPPRRGLQPRRLLPLRPRRGGAPAAPGQLVGPHLGAGKAGPGVGGGGGCGGGGGRCEGGPGSPGVARGGGGWERGGGSGEVPCQFAQEMAF